MNQYPGLLNPDCYIFVLWGTGFEEIAAVIFRAELHQAGLSVKTVGLIGPQAAGIHGIALHPDMTLSEALHLASQCLCIVLPCNSATAHRIENDPRVLTFFEEAALNDAIFIVNDRAVLALTSLHKLAIPPAHVITYTAQQNLIELARRVAAMLQARIGGASTN